MKNYLIYPFKNMKITQTYLGSESHLAHTTGNITDYPIDEAGADGGREYMYCPCNEMTVTRIYGVGNKGANTVWLRSKEPVVFADSSVDYAVIMVTHANDDDLKKLAVGDKFKYGEKMFREGTDGNATGNHLHICVGKGIIKGIGWSQNSNGKWVLTTTNGAVKPEKAFWLDKTVTSVIKDGGLSFKEVPKEAEDPTTVTETKNSQKTKIKLDAAKGKNAKYSGEYKTTAKLNLRAGAGTDKDIILEIPKGAKVRNYGYYTKDTDSVVWLYIAYGEYEGFSSVKYLKKV